MVLVTVIEPVSDNIKPSGIGFPSGRLPSLVPVSRSALVSRSSRPVSANPIGRLVAPFGSTGIT